MNNAIITHDDRKSASPHDSRSLLIFCRDGHWSWLLVCVAWSKLIDFENSIFDRPTQQFNKRKNAIKRLFWELKGFAFFFFWRWRIIVITDWIYGSDGGGVDDAKMRMRSLFCWELRLADMCVTIFEYPGEINVIFGSTSIDIRTEFVVVVFPPTKSNLFCPLLLRVSSPRGWRTR